MDTAAVRGAMQGRFEAMESRHEQLLKDIMAQDSNEDECQTLLATYEQETQPPIIGWTASLVSDLSSTASLVSDYHRKYYWGLGGARDSLLFEDGRTGQWGEFTCYKVINPTTIIVV